MPILALIEVTAQRAGEGELAPWTPATRIGKVNKAGRLKFAAKLFAGELNLASSEQVLLLARASTNFAVATSPTTSLQVIVK